MIRNGRNLRLVSRVIVAVAGTVGAFSEMAFAKPQQLDQPITIQQGQVPIPGAPVEIGYQSFRAMAPGKVVKGAPYSAVADTEMTQLLSDGNQISHKMTSKIYRDGQGRTRREESFPAMGALVINGSHPQSVVFISDPVSGSDYVLEPENKIARRMPSLPPNGITTNKMFVMGATVSGPGGLGAKGVHVSGGEGVPMPEESRFQTSAESLGQQTIEGVVAEGKRTTTTIPAGAMGNQRPIITVIEEWFSPELQVTILSTTKDPRIGETTYRLTNIQRAEPPATFFALPADYTVKDLDNPPPFPHHLQNNE